MKKDGLSVFKSRLIIVKLEECENFEVLDVIYHVTTIIININSVLLIIIKNSEI